MLLRFENELSDSSNLHGFDMNDVMRQMRTKLLDFRVFCPVSSTSLEGISLFIPGDFVK